MPEPAPVTTATCPAKSRSGAGTRGPYRLGDRRARQPVELLPWARRGGDDLVRTYCERVGMAADPRTLERLVVAYWLDRAASQLRTHAEHWDDREWIGSNVEFVARAVGGGGVVA